MTGSAAPSTVSFPCPSCGGGRSYSARAGGLACAHCGRRDAIEPGGGASEHDASAMLSGAASSQGADPPPADRHQGWGQELTCPNCHGTAGFSGSLTAARCPFCASPVAQSDVSQGGTRLPVDGVVPFGIDHEEAEARVREWLAALRYAPKAFKRYAETGSFTGVYLPYLTFAADTTTRYQGQAGTAVDTDLGLYRWREVTGTANTRLDGITYQGASPCEQTNNTYVVTSALKTWSTTNAVAFRPEYLAGKLARTCERHPGEFAEDARRQLNDRLHQALIDQISADTAKIDTADTTWDRVTYRQVLLPAYLLAVRHRGRSHQVLVNGVTGQTHGHEPVSAWKRAAGCLILLLIAAAVIAAVVITVIDDGSADVEGGRGRSAPAAVEVTSSDPPEAAARTPADAIGP